MATLSPSAQVKMARVLGLHGWSFVKSGENRRESGLLSLVLPGFPTIAGELVCLTWGLGHLWFSPASSLGGGDGEDKGGPLVLITGDGVLAIRSMLQAADGEKRKESKGHPIDTSSGYSAITARQRFRFYPFHKNKDTHPTVRLSPRGVLFLSPPCKAPASAAQRRAP